MMEQVTTPEPAGLRPISEERRARRAFRADPDASVVWSFEAAMASVGVASVRREIRRIRSYADTLEYSHPGKRQDVLRAHPLRVATLYLRTVTPPDVIGVGTALVHNAFEATDLEQTELAQAVGPAIAEAVELLTVDRARQWEPTYQEAYYARIADAEQPVRRVKVLDKVDNLFLLHLNPSDDIRERYLEEIETHLMPLVRRDLPDLVEYVEQLVEDSRRIGHRPLSDPDDADGEGDG